MYRRATRWTLLAASVVLVQTAQADSFGSGANTFEIEFVTVGSAGNAPDPLAPTGFPADAGAVSYEYRIGKYEVSGEMINKANAEGDLGVIIAMFGENQPATLLSWNMAARFVNWLNTSQNFPPAYKFEFQPGQEKYLVSSDIELWTSIDPGFDPANPFRNRLAKYFLPSEHEWYKAAYYDPAETAYFEYPTGSDRVPDGIDFSGDAAFDAVFLDPFNVGAPHETTNVGIASPYGTFGQGGNVWEMIESAFVLPNDSVEEMRTIRGGAWNLDASKMRSSPLTGRMNWDRRSGSNNVGFRVASRIPVPGDYNVNGVVDAADYVVWRNNLGQSITLPNSDPSDVDGIVTTAEYSYWRTRFGTASGSATGDTSSLSAVPEPGAMILMASALAGLLYFVRDVVGWKRGAFGH